MVLYEYHRDSNDDDEEDKESDLLFFILRWTITVLLLPVFVALLLNFACYSHSISCNFFHLPLLDSGAMITSNYVSQVIYFSNYFKQNLSLFMLAKIIFLTAFSRTPGTMQWHDPKLDPNVPIGQVNRWPVSALLNTRINNVNINT